MLLWTRKGFLDESEEWTTEDNVDIFYVCEGEKFSEEIDFYKPRYDKIILKIDDEEIEVINNRWQGKTGYYYTIE